jgi:hypothetical protein
MQSARDRWFERLHAERERRRYAALMVGGRNPREAFMETLALMGQPLGGGTRLCRAHARREGSHGAESRRLVSRSRLRTGQIKTAGQGDPDRRSVEHSSPIVKTLD